MISPLSIIQIKTLVIEASILDEGSLLHGSVRLQGHSIRSFLLDRVTADNRDIDLFIAILNQIVLIAGQDTPES